MKTLADIMVEKAFVNRQKDKKILTHATGSSCPNFGTLQAVLQRKSPINYCFLLVLFQYLTHLLGIQHLVFN